MGKEAVVSTYNEILLSHKKNENLPFATTQMDLEGIRLSEMSGREAQIVCIHLYVESKTYNKLVNITEKKKDSQMQQTN